MNPLQNLSTPWILGNGCNESNTNQAVFVQAVILHNGSLETYNPLVIDQGSIPAIAPYPITIQSGDVVGLFGGGNDDNTTLVGFGSSSCVNGSNGLVFGQVFFCNTPQLFNAVKNSSISIPSLGLDNSSVVCPSVRDFRIVDQDQSDNVQSTYIVTSSGQTAQNTAQNRSLLNVASIAKNPSDNRLLTQFVDPAIGCSPWKIHDIADNGNLVATQATDELQAEFYQTPPQALIPSADPMVGPGNIDMVNAYRVSVDQRMINTLGQANSQAYCAHMLDVAPAFFAKWKTQFQASGSPQAGTNLYDFIQGRFIASLMLLGCNQIKEG